MANITKKGDRKYLVRISKQSRKKREFHNFTFKGTLKDAREFARDKETELAKGTLTKSSNALTFEKYFQMWIKAITPKVAPRTLDGYEGYIKRYATATLNDMPLTEIRNYHIQEIYLGLNETKSPTTVRNLNAALRACFSYARKHEYIRTNPCTNIDLPAKHKKEIVVMTFEDAFRFVDACSTMPNGLIFEFAIETGMRPEEYLALRWKDLSGDQVSVQQSVQYNRKGGGFYFAKPKTSKSRRRVPISEALRTRIARHRTDQLKHRLAMKGTWFDNDLIFPNEIGKPFALPNLTRRYFRPILKVMWPDVPDLSAPDVSEPGAIATGLKASKPKMLPNPDLKPFTLYSLRHTCATLLLMSGENPKVVADRLGHSSVTMTLDTYSHVLPHIQADATATISKIMRG
jgi:integrase